MPGSLYVFLHGLGVACDRGPYIQIVLPRVPGHCYRAGGWLSETLIAGDRILALKGATTDGKVSFSDPSIADFMISLPDSSVTDRARAATIILPRAQTIIPALVARHDPHVARTKDGSREFPKLATVQILVYTYTDENEVSLDGHYWEPAAIGGAITLHIISTSETPEGQAHEDMTDDIMGEVLRGYPGLVYFSPRPQVPPWLDPGDLGPLHISDQPGLGQYAVSTDSAGNEQLAFPLAELEHPTSRALRLSHLAHLEQSDRPIDSLWQDPDFLSERIANCVISGTH